MQTSLFDVKIDESIEKVNNSWCAIIILFLSYFATNQFWTMVK